MATKYQLITGVYETALQQVTGRTAVLGIEKWNRQFGRWVNKGTTGIAVFDDGHNGNYRLKHYFDISDTHKSCFSRSVPLWRMKLEYEAEVIESLENSFGELAKVV